MLYFILLLKIIHVNHSFAEKAIPIFENCENNSFSLSSLKSSPSAFRRLNNSSYPNALLSLPKNSYYTRIPLNITSVVSISLSTPTIKLI